ncbi:hypothetical protein MS3_00008751 [Schistosoma haematobium]|uniref:Uncharacterized protein n=1 Tax=Schistosoma haematobium TaxID=6185 RepID=A0A094ZMT7_SCHHA|nr:hypothetical protein MS3_00008751 [Schistosoma haematobium]KAH9581687.1 hypothetical protein MS3_00008751 [Schistosoma haematobium]CAH8615495.1 unnamed protein product [Schistosoma haematobium]
MNPNYPNGPIGYGWGFGQNATTTSLWEQPQIGFCFDSPNPQIPEACPPPIQNPGVIGFAYDQAVANPPLVSPVSSGRSQSNSSTDRTFNVTSPRLNVPPSIEAMRPKSYINYSDESFAPSAPPESISPHSESVKFITITRKDSKKSDTTSKTITNTNDQHNQRRDSYQDSLKDMAALMTDVELTDDMINGMRKRFDLHN